MGAGAVLWAASCERYAAAYCEALPCRRRNPGSWGADLQALRRRERASFGGGNRAKGQKRAAPCFSQPGRIPSALTD